MTVPTHDVKQPDPSTEDDAQQQPVDPSPFSAEKAAGLDKVNVYSFTVFRKSQIALGNQMGERVNAVGTDLAAVEKLLKDNLDPDDVTSVTGGVIQIEGAYAAQGIQELPPPEKTAHSGRTVDASTHSSVTAGTSKAVPKKS